MSQGGDKRHSLFVDSPGSHRLCFVDFARPQWVLRESPIRWICKCHFLLSSVSVYSASTDSTYAFSSILCSAVAFWTLLSLYLLRPQGGFT